MINICVCLPIRMAYNNAQFAIACTALCLHRINPLIILNCIQLEFVCRQCLCSDILQLIPCSLDIDAYAQCAFAYCSVRYAHKTALKMHRCPIPIRDLYILTTLNKSAGVILYTISPRYKRSTQLNDFTGIVGCNQAFQNTTNIRQCYSYSYTLYMLT